MSKNKHKKHGVHMVIVRITTKQKQQIERYGKYGDTFNDVLQRLLEKHIGITVRKVHKQTTKRKNK